jgi:hypothetical protein
MVGIQRISAGVRWCSSITSLLRAAGTGAIQVSNKIWVSMFRGDRVGIFPAK